MTRRSRVRRCGKEDRSHNQNSQSHFSKFHCTRVIEAVSSRSAAVAFIPFGKVRLMILAFLALLGISALCFAVAAFVLALGDDLFLAWVAFVAVPLIVAALVALVERRSWRHGVTDPPLDD